jgi:hypothetical protein
MQSSRRHFHKVQVYQDLYKNRLLLVHWHRATFIVILVSVVCKDTDSEDFRTRYDTDHQTQGTTGVHAELLQ